MWLECVVAFLVGASKYLFRICNKKLLYATKKFHSTATYKCKETVKLFSNPFYCIGYWLIKVIGNLSLANCICVPCALILSTCSKWITTVKSCLNITLTK